jgi:hypothetical protein
MPKICQTIFCLDHSNEEKTNLYDISSTLNFVCIPLKPCFTLNLTEILFFSGNLNFKSNTTSQPMGKPKSGGPSPMGSGPPPMGTGMGSGPTQSGMGSTMGGFGTSAYSSPGMSAGSTGGSTTPTWQQSPKHQATTTQVFGNKPNYNSVIGDRTDRGLKKTFGKFHVEQLLC